MTALTKAKAKPRRPAMHRAIESMAFRTICGRDTFRLTYNWKKVTCKTCRKEKPYYV